MRTHSLPGSQNAQTRDNTRIKFGAQFCAVALGTLMFLSMSNSAFAQRGGGMGGGRGGGMGGGGGRGGGGRNNSESASKKIKSEFEASDPVQFLLKRDKPLKLDKTQKDSLKALHKELDEFEKPIFSDVEKLFTDAEKNKKDSGDSSDPPAAPTAGGGRGGRRMPNGVPELVAKLSDAQLAFKDRARAHLNDSQRHIADSLKVVYDAELQEKEAQQRTQRGGMGGGRGRGQ